MSRHYGHRNIAEGSQGHHKSEEFNKGVLRFLDEGKGPECRWRHNSRRFSFKQSESIMTTAIVCDVDRDSLLWTTHIMDDFFGGKEGVHISET